jgi:hypothetical protein
MGKQLHVFAQALIEVHSDQTEHLRTQDMNTVLIRMCSDNWTQRMISCHLSEVYQFKQRCVAYETLQVFCQLINALQSELNENYSSLA